MLTFLWQRLSKTILAYASGGLLMALALTVAHDRRLEYLRGYYSDGWGAEKKAHAQTVINYVAAEESAQATFDAKIQAQKLRSKETNDETDRKVAVLAAKYRSSVMRLKAATAAGTPQNTGLPETNVLEGADGSSSDTVNIPRNDALICAENTARLQAGHDEVLSLAK